MNDARTTTDWRNDISAGWAALAARRVEAEAQLRWEGPTVEAIAAVDRCTADARFLDVLHGLVLPDAQR